MFTRNGQRDKQTDRQRKTVRKKQPKTRKTGETDQLTGKNEYR